MLYIFAHFSFDRTVNLLYCPAFFIMRFFIFISCAASISSTVATVLIYDSSQSDPSRLSDDPINLDLTPWLDASSSLPNSDAFSVVSNAQADANPEPVNQDDLISAEAATGSTVRNDDTFLEKKLCERTSKRRQ